jgi:hypothetical protein
MANKQTVVYAARNTQEAYLLRNLLSEEGIRGMVINDVLEGGSGVDAVGWATLARVVVDESDYERARHIALVYERKKATAAESQTIAESATKPAAQPPRDWPKCPECGQPRTTQCPFCGAAGSDFPAADVDLMDSSEGCGNFHSPCDTCANENGTVPLDVTPMPESDGVSPPPMLICPTCDEPFVPVYLRRCVWCGHEFGDGIDAPPVAEEDQQLNGRIIAIIVLLLLFGLGSMIYFLFL